MSRGLALVKFSDGEIFIGCYHGICDALSPYLISQEDLNTRYDGNYLDWDDADERWIEYPINPDSITDSEEVQIYIDYGGGFCWTGCTASKSKLYVTSSLSDLDHDDLDYIYRWAYDYFIEHNRNPDHFIDRVMDADMEEVNNNAEN